MTNYDWVKFLFQAIPSHVNLKEPTDPQREEICSGLSKLRDAVRDSDVCYDKIEKKWDFIPVTEECGCFKMGSKRIYWWIDPEQALLTNGEINAEKFNEWTKKEYDRIVGIDR